MKTNRLFCALVAGLLCFGSATPAFAFPAPDGAEQQLNCSGTIIDETGEPVIGASVLVEGTTTGTVTDFDGNFSLANVSKGATLVISYMGYSSQTVVWNGQQIYLTLKEDTEALEEVVVVGFGTQKKVNLTGSVATVSSKELSARPVNSVADALQGAVAGLNLSLGSGGGSVDSDKKLNIRGTGTIGSGSSVEPLVLIDGMEGDINTLNPQDIESMSVLKDASASSIYGSRAAGGVILITTKSGKEGKTSVNYNNSFRFNAPINMPKMMDSYTWAVYMNDASINSGNGVWFTDSKLAQIKAAQSDPTMQTMFANANHRWEVWDSADLLPIGNTDWLSEHFGNSFSHEHTLSANGGTDKFQYYLSANYLGLDGTLRHANDRKDRYSITGKISAQLAKWAHLTYSVRFNRQDVTKPSYIDDVVFYHNLCRYWPIVPVTDPNGYYNSESFINELRDGGVNKSQKDVIAQQLALRLTPVKGLVINAELNYRINDNFQHQDYLTTYGHDEYGVAFVQTNPQENTKVVEYAYKGNYFNPNVFAEYSYASESGHNVKAMIGFQCELYKDRFVKASQNGIIANQTTLHTTSSNAWADGEYNSWATAGFFGRINYDYQGRYLVEANLRYDGSSRFIRERRWNIFPSFSAGWNIAHEPFMEDYARYVSNLKLRGSWGMLGNQNTNNWYPFYSQMGYTSQGGEWLLGGQKPNVSSEAALISSSLTWEKSQTWEVGLDWGFLSNRLTGTVGVFQRKTYDMVGPAPELPEILGTAVPKTNNLDMTSTGWELQVGWRDQVKDFTYGVNFTLGDSRVKINKYPNASKDLGQTYYEGAYLGDIWGYETIGIAKTDEEMNAHLAKVDQSALGSNWAAGDIMYADLDGDGKISSGLNTADNPGDRRIIGNTTPRYNFGLNFDFAYKGFDLKIFFQGTMKRDYAVGNEWGNSVFWGANACGGKWQAAGMTEHLDYFRDDPNHPLGLNLDSYYPRANWDGGKNTYAQTRYLQNGAYGRLKNLTLGYTLPKKALDACHMQNFRLFVSAENLFTITKFTSLSDPELIDAMTWCGFGKNYPLSRTVSFGMNVTF